jgi:hypothetical protein
MSNEESRLEALEDELRKTKEELQEILLDIRTHLMEAQTPIPNDLAKEKIREELKGERG